MRLICYNIEYCEGIEGRWYEYLEIWRALRAKKKLEKDVVKSLKKLKPDVLALVEVDTGSIRNRGEDEVKYISHGTKLNNFVEKVKYPLEGWLRLFHFIPILDRQANAVLSKYKFYDVKYHVFHEGTKRMVIEVSLKCPKKVTLLIAHLALGPSTRAMQINELIGIVNSIDNPVILMGDFNTFNGTKEVSDLLSKTHLSDKIGLDKDDLPLTEPSWNPCRRLDYILTSRGVHVNNYKVLKFPFSDHLPLMVDFDVK